MATHDEGSASKPDAEKPENPPAAPADDESTAEGASNKQGWWPPWRRHKGAAGPTSVAEVDKELQKALKRAKAANAWTDVRLRRWLGFGALVLMALQMTVANTAFFIYGFSNHWNIPVSGMQVWLAATVVQVAVIVRAVAKYLFPPDGDEPGK